MGRIAGLFTLLLVCFLAAQSATFADHIDGMTLMVSYGAASGGVTLDWTGGQPLFRVYRSTSPQTILDPGNLIGTTDVRTFGDMPPVGVTFFYEIASPCVYNPPEVCNGLDDDCDGTVDGPGSAASCSLPNAVATCAQGACAIASCNSGFGDCDASPADGCETPLDVAQSNSPAAIWANDPNPNQDLKPGYVRVAGITDCGACGVTCDDGVACTTDLCVPVNQGGSMTGVCRHYDRGQCSEARCGGLPLPPGTPPPGDPTCTAADADGDGLSDTWEVAQTDPYTGGLWPRGIDLDCDGEISGSDRDFIYSDPPVGPLDKDIYVKVAYMAQSTAPGPPEPGSHRPLTGALDAVVAAFARQGIALHIDPVMPEVPHSSVVYFPVAGPDACATGDAVSFYAIKGTNFDPHARYTHRFILFAHDSCYAGASVSDATGLAEMPGNDIIVSLGDATYTGSETQVHELRLREEAGTLMHELGHTLRLNHGGPDEPCSPQPCDSAPLQQKPNYISSMNYSFQLPVIPRSATPGSVFPLDPTVPWRVDFSHAPRPTLVESNLDEIAGLGGASPPYDRDVARYYCLGPVPYLAPGQGPVDWNCDGVYSPSVVADIDADGTLATLPGAEDWGNLDFRFQCNPTFLDGADDPAYVTRRELTLALADARGLRAAILCQTDADCDDGNFCNGVETCTPATGACHPGTPPVCDDLNPCTTEGCSQAANACVHIADAADGTPCASGAYCVVGTTCTNGVCGGGAPRDCDDGLPCTADACSETLRACTTSCTTAPCWSAPAGPGIAAAPASNAVLVSPDAPTTSYVIKGNTLYAFRNTGDALGPPGSPRWTWTPPTGATLDNFPNPVVLSSGGSSPMFIFVGAEDGSLYKIRADDGVATAVADTRRAGCATDTIQGTPAVQLYRFANAAFKNEMDSHPGHIGDDVVFVATRNQCGDSTRNRVIAYFASDLSVKMVFNDPATHKMDFVSDGCAIDYANNRLYCGTNQPAGGTQNTLWALDGSSFLVVWSENAGSIVTRPILANNRLYVATSNGTVMAYDPAGDAAGGALRLWTSLAVVPAAITRTPWVEFRPGGYQGTILVVDAAGNLTRFTDAGSHATKNWSVRPGPGLTFTSMATVDPAHGMAYLGRDDGYVQQIDLSTGASGVTRLVASDDMVFDPSLDFTRLTVAAGSLAGLVAQFCTWPPPSGGCLSDADCAGLGGACSTGTCDVPSGVCVRVPKPDGTPCNDGLSCTSSDACRSGVCQAEFFSTCPCVGTPDTACPPGLTCCGSGACRDLLADPANCGSCGNVCPPDRTCSEGACIAAPAACASPTAATLTGAGLLLAGGDAVAFDRPAFPGAVCSAYLSTYRYPATSTVQRVDPAGAVMTMNSPSSDAAPLNGIAVPREGNQVFATAVNRPLGAVPTTTPGLIEGAFSPAHLVVARSTLATYSSVPFAAAMYNQGPVGPAFDYQTYSSSAGDSLLYYGNWAANGDVVELRRTCPVCPWTQTQLPIAITPPGDRITAIAFERQKNPGPTEGHHSLYIGHGSVLTIVDLDSGSQSNIDLAAGAPPPTVSAILSIAVHPAYGEILVEVRDTSSFRYLIDIDAHDHSARHAMNVQTDLHLQPLVPPGFNDDGRLVFMPDGRLLRFVPSAITTKAPTFASYQVTK